VKLEQAVKQVLSNVRARNVEIYAVIILTTTIAFLALFDVVSIPVALAALLTAAALTAVLELERVTSIDRIEVLLRSMSRGSTMENFHDEDYNALIDVATRVTFVSILNYRFLAANIETLAAFLKRGGELRQMMMDVNSNESMYSATIRSAGASNSEEHTRIQSQLTIDTLVELASDATAETPLIAKSIPFATAHVISRFEFDHSPGIIYVTPTGFLQKTELRPTFVIREDTDPVGYKYFSDYSDNFWTWSRSVKIDLTKTS
jgi:hypothetical protein